MRAWHRTGSAGGSGAAGGGNGRSAPVAPRRASGWCSSPRCVASVAIVPPAAPVSAGVYDGDPRRRGRASSNDQFVNTDALFAYILRGRPAADGFVSPTQTEHSGLRLTRVRRFQHRVIGIRHAVPPDRQTESAQVGTFRLRGEQLNPITKEWVEQSLSEPFSGQSVRRGRVRPSTIGADAAAAFKASVGNVKELHRRHVPLVRGQRRRRSQRCQLGRGEGAGPDAGKAVRRRVAELQRRRSAPSPAASFSTFLLRRSPTTRLALNLLKHDQLHGQPDVP